MLQSWPCFSVSPGPKIKAMATWQITNGRLFLPEGERKLSGLVISGGRIDEVIGPDETRTDLITLNLHGLCVYPGLINSHDSLFATYTAVKGENWPHLNWLSFDVDLKRSPLFRERMLLDPATLYELGAWKNLSSGATSVVDHIPAFVRSPFLGHLSVSLLPDFGISHSICSYSLGWGDGMQEEHARARDNGLPYITHIAEGFDPESQLSLRVLDRAGCLSEFTVLVHGVSLTQDDLDRVAETGASFVWCPSANLAVYNKTVQIAQFLERGIPVCLGTDAAVTGSTGLIQEIDTARRVFREQTGEELSGEQILDMTATSPGKAFRWENKGTLRPESDADLLILDKPLEEAGLADIHLVVVGGSPAYGSADLEPLFVSLGVEIERITVAGREKIVQKGVKKLRETVQKATGRDSFAFIPGW